MGPNPLAHLIMSQDNVKFDPSGTYIHGTLGYKIERKKLHLKAIYVGTIMAKSETGLDLTNLGSFEQLALLLLQCMQPYTLTGQDRVEVLWRTLIFDMDDFYHPAPATLAPSFGVWMKSLILKGPARAKREGADASAFLRSLTNLERLASTDQTGLIPKLSELEAYAKSMEFIQDSTHSYTDDERDATIRELVSGREAYQAVAFGTLAYRRLFLLQEGYLGLGPHSLDVGDTVWIVSGCPSLLVLRKHQRHPGCYILLGETYVHGIMHGEFVEGDVDWKAICLV